MNKHDINRELDRDVHSVEVYLFTFCNWDMIISLVCLVVGMIVSAFYTFLAKVKVIRYGINLLI